MELDRDKIIDLFHQLDNVIARLIKEENLTSDTKYKFFIFGGSALLLSTNYPTRRTQDIDAGYNYEDDIIKKAIKEVSFINPTLDEQWLNAWVSKIKRGFSENFYSFCKMDFINENFKHIAIYLPPPDLILCMKLYSVNKRPLKDGDDIKFLVDLLRKAGNQVNSEFIYNKIKLYFGYIDPLPKLSIAYLDFLDKNSNGT